MIVADYANQLDTPEIVDRSLKRDDHINDYDNDHDGSHDKFGGVDLFILFYLAQDVRHGQVKLLTLNDKSRTKW